MKNRILYTLCFTLATPALAQFQLRFVGGINLTSINNGQKDSYYVSEFPRDIRFTGGLETEYSLRGESMKAGHLSFASGLMYLKNGYSDNYFFDFFGTELGYLSNFSAAYVQVPLLVRYNVQPMPLVEDFTFFIGAGASSNILMKAELTESFTDVPCFGCGVQSFEASGEITDYGRKVSFFGVAEAGFAFKRTQFIVRHKRSLQDMYFKNLEGNWGIPPESSHYMLLYNQTGKLREIHWELLLTYRLF